MIAKTEQEIAALREGGRRLARHVRELSKFVKPGVTAAELEKKAREMVRADGDEPAFLGHKDPHDKTGYPSALCLSINDVIVHSPAAVNDAVIKDGDIVCLDFGIKHKGLYTDHAVTVIAGTPKSKDDVKLLRGTKEALVVGITQALVGNTTGDIGAAVEEVAEKYHFGFPRNLSGHGVGKKVHEEPHVPNFGDSGKGTKLVEGLVIAIEPMMTLGKGDLYVDKDNFSYRTKDGSRTAHFEHTVLITKNGPEILTIE
ncbi:MAG: Methionine aminopeptidase [Candidatus Kaiserbacteria bacterium GW2011_GWC2_52_8b]|uniref:Methionine aminopeptidase n=2 Tax=Candidatus Kaiseribacteriota TaxID=1752734 RepID=A0A0G2AB55_9BACT|nr:MAG: Methionine aminopeptidase [Candidatus Kaiserbacteria bacterium GW2011_GWA2_52_12]KKW29599.1 MAG: Methionine aminopeptidase [Candidatus Kaiserbacteria bacterium GW2011_GWC2_52_8b]